MRLSEMPQSEWDEEMAFMLKEGYEAQSFLIAASHLGVSHSSLRGRKVHTEVPYYLRAAT